ncbi:MAG: AbrB/MazE/SpoVT family DNA-binding domain-containing protein [Thermodesulfobacteriota bacterium]
MLTVKTTTKGQVTIPAALRKKLNIHQGTRLLVEEKNGKIIMDPLPDDLLKAGRGRLKTKGETLKNLLADRKADTE